VSSIANEAISSYHCSEAFQSINWLALAGLGSSARDSLSPESDLIKEQINQPNKEVGR
jgi:hypothetical protein